MKRLFSSVDRTELSRVTGRLMALARSELALLTALLVGAAGVLTFIEIADDMTEADGRAFDAMVL
ncbi:MAG: phosphoesterase, partial [Brevundimonas sp.]